MKYLPITSLLIITLSSNAEVITDGTLGQQQNLPGPNFQITSNQGQQHGGNLFHSFHDFNLNSSESATFSGPNSVQNILSRVTGGNLSNIDGLIRSTIPNADMYFLNPYGIMFGPNARLDVQGSFHASTADYLRLGENGRFDARYPSDSLLTVAPIESFGFLTDSPANMTLQDSILSVGEGKTLSIIGGDLDLIGNTPPITDENAPNFQIIITSADSEISASSGYINLASVASKGEIVSNKSELNKGDTLGGQIRINKTFISVNGQGDGRISIRGKNLIVTNGSQIQAKKLSGNNQPNNGQEISVDINVDTLFFNNRSGISGDSLSTENSGDIVIKASNISFHNDAEITNRSISSGDSGNIILTVDNILLEDSGITTITNNSGNSGDIYIRANETIKITGTYSDGWNGGLASVSAVTGENRFTGVGGDIILDAKKLIITNGGKISSSTIVRKDGQSQQAGNIDIHVSDSIELSGINPYGANSNGLGSGIIAASSGLNAGNAGTVSLTANALSITDGADIIVSTSGKGKGGHINLNINGPISISGDSSHILLKEPRLSQLMFQKFFNQDNKISISSIYANSFGDINDAGDAGNINIKANQITLGNNNKITTGTENSIGGNINIKITNLLHSDGGQIFTSVKTGTGNGGNITIKNPTFVVLNQGQIKAQADEGHGGNINIKSKQFITSPNSLISASSNLGLDGEVNIDSLNIDMEGFLVVLSDETVEASSQMKRPCSMRGSSFFVKKINGSPQTPYDYQPAQYLPEIDNKVKTVSKKTGEKLAFSTCKK
ncbi:filamentous hemagglutinin N-terminal domain-containing protein [Candidatus Halobeggiatoa sp. HSG11]|nr:filamentous hemagglutinin N-terminal domain-containing protein [Candidatus Halobeggiatoa sp. HSG11]